MSRRNRSRHAGDAKSFSNAANDRSGHSSSFSRDWLSQRRFDTSPASENFLHLRYLDDAFKGSTDNAIRLPPNEQPVSTTPSSGGMVYKAFSHGLMYGDEASLMDGLGAFLGLIVGVFFWALFFTDAVTRLFMFNEGFFLGVVNMVIIITMIVMIPFATLLFLETLMGYRFKKCVLLDRNAGKVHVFTDKTVPWRGNRSQVKTYDWAQVRAEVDTMSVFTGTLGRTEAGLRGVVYDVPGGAEVIDQFPLGVNVPQQNVQPLLDTWEHARRFMQHEGPLFSDEHDGPNSGLGRQPLWRYLWMFPGMFVESSREFFVDGWRNKDVLMLAFAVLGCFLLAVGTPVMALFGLFPWLGSLFKSDPKWPPEVLASVGGKPLVGDDLAAWRSVVPEKKPLIHHPTTPTYSIDTQQRFE